MGFGRRAEDGEWDTETMSPLDREVKVPAGRAGAAPRCLRCEVYARAPPRIVT